MGILGIIMIVVGVTLLAVGRNVANSLPPNYQQEEDEEFLKLLQKVGKMLSAAGILLILVGILCLLFG